VLDYGGGSGLLAAKLRDQGFDAATYDPFSDHNQLPDGKFDLITCFEVMEHVPFPKETVAAICGLLKEGGAILFSTLVQPAEFAQIGLNWWYAGPRNGHVSLYSSAALGLLFQEHGLKVGSFNEGFHIAYGTVPEFAGHLTLPG
jgi:2-polyprenyl-6-hydroxyphenyl methylase/3-demethylubiquinone-9 3-methyltransferase